MAKIFVIANQKGGVGKTTTTVNLAASLHKHGQRTLLVDLDPQGNATMGSGVDKRSLPRSVYQVMLGMSSVAESTHVSPSGGYSVLGANRDLAGAEVELVDVERREERLKNALAAVDDLYDFVLIDCPPSLSLLTLNGFCAAHGVIIPMQCEYFALEGLSDLVNTIKKVHANFNTNLRVIGLLRVMFDPRMTLGQQVSRQLEQHFGDKVFKAVIPRNVRLAEAPSYGMPGVIYDPQSKGAKAYLEFGAEMVSRLNQLDAAAARSAAQSARPASAAPTNTPAQTTGPQPSAPEATSQPQSGPAQPQTTTPNTAQPQTPLPDAPTAQTPPPDAAQPQATPPNATQPQPTQPNSLRPQAAPEATPPWSAPSRSAASPTLPAATNPVSTTHTVSTTSSTVAAAALVAGANGPPGHESTKATSHPEIDATNVDTDPPHPIDADGSASEQSYPMDTDASASEQSHPIGDPSASAQSYPIHADPPAPERSYPMTTDSDVLSSSARADGDALPVQETTASAT